MKAAREPKLRPADAEHGPRLTGDGILSGLAAVQPCGWPFGAADAYVRFALQTVNALKQQLVLVPAQDQAVSPYVESVFSIP
jgi:hypothetical protein